MGVLKRLHLLHKRALLRRAPFLLLAALPLILVWFVTGPTTMGCGKKDPSYISLTPEPLVPIVINSNLKTRIRVIDTNGSTSYEDYEFEKNWFWLKFTLKNTTSGDTGKKVALAGLNVQITTTDNKDPAKPKDLKASCSYNVISTTGNYATLEPEQEETLENTTPCHGIFPETDDTNWSVTAKLTGFVVDDEGTVVERTSTTVTFNTQ